MMAEEIIKLIKDPQKREQLGKNALERVKELTWDKVSVKLIDAYAVLGN
jgi:glycosyltransferase involved in cell wall biosynthesis